MKNESLTERSIRIGKQNRADILAYKLANPFCSQRGIAKALGLNYVTVAKHVKAIKRESGK